jgi:peptide/nickel transport system ATP-binding protein
MMTKATMKLLTVEHVSKTFHSGKGIFGGNSHSVAALDDVSLTLDEGGFAAILGESGSGKTTLGKIICGLIKPVSGSINMEGKNIEEFSRFELSTKVQMIFQDPFASLNPKLSIRTILSEALLPNVDDGELLSILKLVGLSPDTLTLYPHHFSGGQRQRIAIARALLKKPKLIIADEPLSALDVSIQAQILELFAEVKKSAGISFIFISHDIVTASNIADYFYIMKQGRIVEKGESRRVIEAPETDYTKTLLSAVPS